MCLLRNTIKSVTLNMRPLVFVWTLPETDPKTRIWAQILGVREGDLRKYQEGSGKVKWGKEVKT